jgi:hypothetical protein
LRGEPTTRPIWSWLTLLAVLLLPVDVAVRRLALSRRDLARAWTATLGRRRRQVAIPQRSEQVSRLFEAKERAGTSHSGEGPAPPPSISQEPPAAPPVGEPAADQAKAPPRDRKEAVAPAEGTSLASRLLERRRQQWQADEDEQPGEG